MNDAEKQTEDRVQNPAEEGGEEKKIPKGPEEEPGGQIEPDLPVPPEGAAPEQKQAGGEPEEKIQQGWEEGAAAGPTRQTEKVIKQPQSPAQCETEGEGTELVEDGQAHARKRRPRKLP